MFLIIKTWLPFALFGVLWCDLIRQLSYHWEANEQYAYGWFVPLLAIGLFWKKWITRPAPLVVVPQPGVIALIATLAALLLPARVIYEISPDWPLISWAYALMVVALSLYGIFTLGGMTWVKYLAFPVCFHSGRGAMAISNRALAHSGADAPGSKYDRGDFGLV